MLGTYADVGRATQYAQDSPQLKWLRHGALAADVDAISKRIQSITTSGWCWLHLLHMSCVAASSKWPTTPIPEPPLSLQLLHGLHWLQSLAHRRPNSASQNGALAADAQLHALRFVCCCCADLAKFDRARTPWLFVGMHGAPGCARTCSPHVLRSSCNCLSSTAGAALQRWAGRSCWIGRASSCLRMLTALSPLGLPRAGSGVRH